MSNIDFRSAVLLIHDDKGAQAILNGQGGMSSATTHDLNYNGRQREYEEKGGCERDLTFQDKELIARDELGYSMARVLNYDARQEEYSEKGKERMEDATWWGQDGPWTRKALEEDMARCGGAALRSLITVDRTHAHELGLDTKDAFQKIMRDNWQRMMMEAGIARNPADIHWYACYHTDANESLHVHIVTWVAKTPLEEGWTVGAKATRDMKGMLYEDAYAKPRLERDIEKNYLRSLLPAIAKAELGMRIPEKTLEIIGRNAETFGVAMPKIEKTLDEEAERFLSKKQEVLLEKLEQGDHGNLWKNYDAYSAAFKLVDALAQKSEPFAEAFARYREYLEEKADMKGLAIPKERDKEILIEQLGSIAKAERALEANRQAEKARLEFIDSELKDIKRRIAYPLMRETLPEVRREDIVREVAREIKPNLVRDALHTRQNLLELSSAAQQEIKHAIQASLGVRAEDRTEDMQYRLEKATDLIVESKVCQERVGQAANKLQLVSTDYKNEPLSSARLAIEEALKKDILNELDWRLERQMVAPYGVEAWDMSKELLRERSNGFLYDMLRTEGVSLGLRHDEFLVLKDDLNIAVGMATRGEAQETIHIRCQELAERIISTPTMQTLVDDSYQSVLRQYGSASAPTRERVEKNLTDRVARFLEGTIVYKAEQGKNFDIGKELDSQQHEQTHNIGVTDLGLGVMAAQMVRQLISERDVALATQNRERGQKRPRKR